MRLRHKMAPPEPGPEAESQSIAPDPCGDAASEATFSVTCGDCQQTSASLEMDLLPEREETIKWHKKNRSRTSGLMVPYGTQCYPCFAEARKQGFGNQDALHKHFDEAEPGAKERFLMARRSRVRGESRYSRKATATATSVEESNKTFETMKDEGYAYYLDDYLRNLKAGAAVLALPTRNKFQWLREVHNVAVYKDENNDLVFRESNLPGGA